VIPVRSDGRRNWPRVLAGVIAIWAFYIGMIMLQIVPYTPRSFRGWALLLIAGPPVYLAVEWVGERVLSPRLARIPKPARFSLGWFVWMVAATAFGSALVGLSVWWSLRFGR
jgi:hypothetical protein